MKHRSDKTRGQRRTSIFSDFCLYPCFICAHLWLCLYFSNSSSVTSVGTPGLTSTSFFASVFA
jgi:hypothetical protein